MKKKTSLRAFHVLYILYSRNEVYKRQWLRVKAISMAAAVAKLSVAYPADVEEQEYEGVHAATSLGEDYLIIVAATRANCRIVHSIVVEQNEGY